MAPINEAMRESTASKCLKGAVGYSHRQLRYAPWLVSRLCVVEVVGGIKRKMFENRW